MLYNDWSLILLISLRDYFRIPAQQSSFNTSTSFRTANHLRNFPTTPLSLSFSLASKSPSFLSPWHTLDPLHQSRPYIYPSCVGCRRSCAGARRDVDLAIFAIYPRAGLFSLVSHNTGPIRPGCNAFMAAAQRVTYARASAGAFLFCAWLDSRRTFVL